MAPGANNGHHAENGHANGHGHHHPHFGLHSGSLGILPEPERGSL